MRSPRLFKLQKNNNESIFYENEGLKWKIVYRESDKKDWEAFEFFRKHKFYVKVGKEIRFRKDGSEVLVEYFIQ